MNSTVTLALSVQAVRPDTNPEHCPEVASLFVDNGNAQLHLLFWYPEQAEALAAEALRCAERLRAHAEREKDSHDVA